MKKIFILFMLMVMTLGLQAKLTQSPTVLTTDYTVQNGDTLYLIAQKHHTTVHEINQASGLGLHAVIKVGQKLTVPLNTYFPHGQTEDQTESTSRKPLKPLAQSSSPKTVDYVVQNGDTLFTIARAHHTSINAVLKANAMDRMAVIKVGEHLRVPVNTYFAHGQTNTVSVKSSRGTPLASVQKETKMSPSVSSPSKESYVVGTGDTLFSIARKNHIVISKLMRLNGLSMTDALHVGQVLRISANPTFVAAAKPSKGTAKHPSTQELPVGAMPSYTVKKGDTLWRIARKHHLTLAEIRRLNKMHKKDAIRTGMILAVGKAVQPRRKVYKVRKGDTLWLIAKKNNMSTKKLRQLNHMRRKDRIHTGMLLALSPDAKIPNAKLNRSKRRQMIATLKKKGAKKSEIEAVLTRVKKSRKKQPDIAAILAQVKREEKKKRIETPLRIAKKRQTKKRSRYGSAAAILNGRSSSHSRSASRTIRIAKRYLGRRYVWGAVGPRSFDCSGFTQYVMRKSKGVRIPRVSRKQAYYGRYISRSHLRPGDLIFFDTSRRRRGYVNHVGIYIGNHKFIHASSARHRVVITSLDRPFYSARFKWGRRVN